jgi:tetratricopeptide (TPR) repeat protein
MLAKDVYPPYTLSLGARGGYMMPMGENADVLNGGPSFSVFMNFNPKLINNLLLQPEVSYTRFNLKTNTSAASSYWGFGLNLMYNIPIVKFLEINTLAGGGYYYNRVVDTSSNVVLGTASNPYFKVGGGLDFNITYNFNMNAGVAYQNYYASDTSTTGLALTLAGNYRFGKSPEEKGYDRSIEIDDVTIYPLFSALYKYYENTSAGTITITNISKKEVKKIKASVMVKDYMDYPTASKTVDVLAPGDSVDIDLHVLFSNRVLNVTEDTPLSANVSVNYIVAERDFTKDETITFKLYNRNAMTWDDDNKLASFITPKDTPIKVFARSVVQQYQTERVNILNQNMQSALEIFNALGVYGLTYVPDPKTPYVKFAEDESAVDYIQYPRETLRFKAGDCDDMTALYCSLLENVGISTATVTIPGHIFMMLDTGVSRYDYREITDDRGMVVEKDEKVWIPVEVTLSGKSFLVAWQEGAKQYNQAISNNDAVGLHPSHEAWQLYSPVTLEEWDWEPDVPSKSDIATLYNSDMTRLVGNELDQKVREIKAQIRKDNKNSNLHNKLGVTYARYGKYREAVQSLERAVQLNSKNAAAYHNLGNVYYLTAEYERALSYYRKALNYSESPIILINIAKTLYKLGAYNEAKTHYLSAVEKDIRFEKKYAYIGAGTEATLRASDRMQLDYQIEWYYTN